MRKVIASEWMSLDEVVQVPSDPMRTPPRRLARRPLRLSTAKWPRSGGPGYLCAGLAADGNNRWGKDNLMPKITPFLWFDTDGEEAAKFYTSVFPNSRIVEVTRYGSGRTAAGGDGHDGDL